MIPRTRVELQVFCLVSITAGICEEILYRGFLIWYIREHLAAAEIAGTAATSLALFLSSLVFGFGHVYLGAAGVVRAAIVGGLLGWFYLLTGSLWVPMILHATIDISSGATGRAAYQEVSTEDGGLANAGS